MGKKTLGHVRWWGLVAVVCAACDGGGPMDEDVVAGTWAVEREDGCLALMTFAGAAYDSSLLCKPSAGGPGLQKERGNFAVMGGKLELRVRTASCTEGDPVVNLSFRVEGTELRTSADSYSLDVWRRVKPPELGKQTVGCYRATGFVVQPELEI